MSDQPSLDYTINDPTSVECPYCHAKMNLDQEIAGVTEYNTHCDLCGQEIWCEVQVDVNVLAWKPEARR